MRLTARLHGRSLKWLMKQRWLQQGYLREPKLKVPKFLQERGIDAVDVEDDHYSPLPKPEPWQPPRPDPRFLPDAQENEHPDWHDTAVYDFNHDCCLLEGEKQSLILTKSRPYYNLPEQISDLIGKVTISRQDELVQRIIMQANKWDPTKEKLPRRYNKDLPIWKFKAEWGIPKERTISIVISNLVRLCQSLGSCHDDLLDSRLVSYDHLVSAFYYLHGNEHIQVSGNHECLVNSSHPLPPFAGEDEVDSTVMYKLPDIFPVAPTIDLAQKHVWRQENMTGWQAGCSHPYPHTLLFSNTQPWGTEEQNARALMYCFAYTSAQAKQCYGWDVKQLPQPICLQCVHTDGATFHFMCFQLNTLNMETDDGIKNMVWFDSDNAMYKKLEPRRAMLRNTKYEDYDSTVFEKLLAFYINGAMLGHKKETSRHHL